MAEWEAYFKLEPLGEQRADMRMARLAALLANIHRNPKKRSRVFEEKEFVFEFSPKKKKQTVEEMRQALMLMAGKSM